MSRIGAKYICRSRGQERRALFFCVCKCLLFITVECRLDHEIIMYVFVSVYVISLGFDNVINEGEKLHFTPRLIHMPPNPSSFYASPEPTLTWPTLTQSHCLPETAPPPLSLCLSLSHTHKCNHELTEDNVFALQVLSLNTDIRIRF